MVSVHLTIHDLNEFKMSKYPRPTLLLLALLAPLIHDTLLYLKPSCNHQSTDAFTSASDKCSNSIIFAQAKGVAGLGKAGGDSQGGSDKAGQQVPPEVYIALTYAGSAFLLSLSVPFLCYGGNKLLNKILACFGRREPSMTKHETKKHRPHHQLQQKQLDNEQRSNLIEQLDRQPYQNQRLHQQLMQQQYSKYHKTHPFAMSCNDAQLCLQLDGNSNVNNHDVSNASPLSNHLMKQNGKPQAINNNDSSYRNSPTVCSNVDSQQQRHPTAQDEQQPPFTISSPHL